MLLDPPITVEVLAHMASFQAAIQIIQPLTDSAWEVLKPRLLSQREEAEQREKDRLAQNQVAQERFNERLIQDTQSMGPDSVDKEWDDVQAPLRARIGGYADEIIRDGWQSGAKVNHDTIPKFAAEVLIYVRKRFYAEQAKDEAAIRATGREPIMDPPEGPFTRKLSLENMKWVFETKIKPYTDSHRKELFLCRACDYVTKYYGFEGVVQHFAAKHTSALSYGSVVVHWRAEWPEDPPFNPDPDSVVVRPYYTAAPISNALYTNGAPSQQHYGYSGYQPVPVSNSMHHANPQSYQESPSSYYGHPQYGETYPNHQNGLYAPLPQNYPDIPHGYQAPDYSAAPPVPEHTGYAVTHPGNGYNGMNQGYQPGFSGQYPPPAQESAFPPQHSVQQYPPTTAASTYQPQPYALPSAQQGPLWKEPAATNYISHPIRNEAYISQLKFIAKAAREIWNAIGHLKVPGNLKVHTIIYHVLRKSHDKFSDDPPLSMINEGLTSNKDMRPVRNINGLRCKACSLGMVGTTPTLQKKLFSLPQLVNHFQSIHEEKLPIDFVGHRPDWTKDMIELPEISALMSVSRVQGMKEEKLKLFMEALPDFFAPEKRSMEILQEDAVYQYGDASQVEYPQLAPSQDNHDRYYGKVDSGRPSEAGSVTYDSNEYDPRRPNSLLTESRPHVKEALPSIPHEREYSQAPAYRLPQTGLDSQDRYAEYPDRSYVEARPLQSRSMDDYGRVVVHEEQVYVDRPIRYRDEVEYLPRSSHRSGYDEMDHSLRDHRVANSQAYASNKQDPTPYPQIDSHPRKGEDTTAQASRILEVVAKISQQAQQVRDRPPVRPEPVEGGSEDGELRAEDNVQPDRYAMRDEAGTLAHRFLDEIRPEKSAEDQARRQDALRARYEAENPELIRRVEQDGRSRYVDPTVEETSRTGYIIRDRDPSRVPREIIYENSYISHPEVVRDRSPEMVDRHYKPPNIVYRDERQDNYDTHRVPSRYARYESVRRENERTRSGSPVYVKTGPPPSQYRERSPAPSAYPLHQEPIYRTRSPPQLGSERRPEYHYMEEAQPRPKEPQYAEAFEYVRVADPAGDYMIKRPVRREPVYYEDEGYARQPVFDSRPPLQRMEEQYDEYDPRVPVPGQPPAAARQFRYQ
jgi:hypothetical protein